MIYQMKKMKDDRVNPKKAHRSQFEAVERKVGEVRSVNK